VTCRTSVYAARFAFHAPHSTETVFGKPTWIDDYWIRAIINQTTVATYVHEGVNRGNHVVMWHAGAQGGFTGVAPHAFGSRRLRLAKNRSWGQAMTGRRKPGLAGASRCTGSSCQPPVRPMATSTGDGG